jgi:hypothetical protein
MNKLNFNKIFKSYLGYHNLENLCVSPNCLKGLQKSLFAMIRQLGLSTFFVIFTFTKRLW